jgi:hypothetical protein
VVGPELRQFGDVIVAFWAGSDIAMEFARFTEHRDSLSAELTVSNGQAGHLHWSRINLSSATGRRDVIHALTQAHPIEGWQPMLTRACQLVAIHLRTGEPAQEITPHPPSPSAWLITPWVPRDQITVLYGPGGTAKSLFVLATMLSALMGHTLGSPWSVGHLSRVLYLDWEADKTAHDQRTWKLLSAIEALPAGRLYHKRLRRPLVDVASEIRAEAHKMKVDGVVMDSLGAACGPEPEGASAALSTLQALGSLPGTKLVIAHESKADLAQGQGQPFGSVYVWNTARSCIEIRPQESDGPDMLSVTLRHAKNNDGPKAQPVGLTFTFGDTITLSRTKADPSSQTLSRQVLDALSKSPGMAVTPLAEMLGAKVESVRRVLYRLTEKERVSQMPSTNGGESIWYRKDT